MGVLRQPLRLALVVIAGLALAVAVDVARVGGPEAWLARHRVPAPYLGGGERVDIGGRSLYLDCRGSGSPTIVLEAGMGDGVAAWNPVLDGMAATTRTCAYDRAGRGLERRPRATHRRRRRRRPADAAGRPPASRRRSWSSGTRSARSYARVFADRFRDDVAGLVLVDGFGVDLETDWIHPLLGELRGEYEGRAQGLRDMVAGVEDLDWPTSEQQLRDADVSGVPVVVLRAPRGEPRLDDATNEAIATAWESAYGRLSPGNVRYEIAWGAGHVIQADRPDLVIAAARDLVAGSRGE